VHDADLVEAGRRCRVHVVGDHTRNVARRERMEIDLALDRKADGRIVVSRQSLVPSQSSVVSRQSVVSPLVPQSPCPLANTPQ
jgi:hypothetical protein